MTSHVIIELCSGLGNQIFQYATGLAIQEELGCKISFNPSIRNTHGNRDYRQLLDISGEKLYSQTILDFKTRAFDAWTPVSLVGTSKTVLIKGYFQYLPAIRSVLPAVSEKLLTNLPQVPRIKAGFVHVRRGDYMASYIPLYVQTKEYYEDGMKLLKDDVNSWIMVSDDIEWCKKQTRSQHSRLIFLEEPDEILTLSYMISCSQAAVISNSTFSWWGAILGAYARGNRVVYPAYWHTRDKPNLFPSSWIPIATSSTLRNPDKLT